MEPVPQTYVPNQPVASAELNDLCTRAAGSQPADSNNHLVSIGVAVTPAGSSEVAWVRGVTGSTLGTGNLVVVDASIDWRDRILRVEYAELGGGTTRQPGNANDFLFDLALSAVRCGYTGAGAKNGAAAGPPSAGDPPVPAAGASWALQIATNLWLYADWANASPGALTLYNDTGSTITVPVLFVRTTAATGYRP